MDRGRLVAVDTPQNLINRMETTSTVKLGVPAPLPEDPIISLNGGLSSIQTVEANTYLLRLNQAPEALDTVLQTIVGSNIRLDHLEIGPVTLEDVFLELTGNELRD